MLAAKRFGQAKLTASEIWSGDQGGPVLGCRAKITSPAEDPETLLDAEPHPTSHTSNAPDDLCLIVTGHGFEFEAPVPARKAREAFQFAKSINAAARRAARRLDTNQPPTPSPHTDRTPTPRHGSDNPGWRADPNGIHQHRYWDGSNWTNHVANNGIQTTDPHT